jgi:hypothetical protein
MTAAAADTFMFLQEKNAYGQVRHSILYFSEPFFILILGYRASVLIRDGVSARVAVKPLVDELITTTSRTCSSRFTVAQIAEYLLMLRHDHD